MFGLALEAFSQGKTRTQLLLDASSAKPGDTVWAGVELKMRPHWHTYWRNCGDAGLPTMITWSLPPGVSAGAVNWPLPEKTVLSSGDISIITYQYHDMVVLLVPIKLDPGLPAGRLKIEAAVNWLECHDTGGCVPGNSIISARLTVGAMNRKSSDAKIIERWRSQLPAAGTNELVTAQWEIVAADDSRAIVIDWKTSDQAADFYPYESQHGDLDEATQHLPAPPGHVRLRKLMQKGDGDWPKQVSGVLVSGTKLPAHSAFEVNLTLGTPSQ